MPEKDPDSILFPNVLTDTEILVAAKNDLGEDPKNLQDCIDHLRKWIEQSPHLHNIRKDDLVLKTFLRGCKYSLEKSKEKLDFFFTVRTTLPSWFDNWDPRQAAVQAYLNKGVYLPLPGYDKHGRFCVLMRPGTSDPNHMKIEDGFKVSTMMMEYALRVNEQAQVKGLVLIQDMAGMTASHAAQVNPALAKKAMTVWQDASPQNPKAMHFLNMPGVIETVFRMMQTLQKEKMRKRNVVHSKGDYSQLIDDIGADILPKEYGGNNVSVDVLRDFWKKETEENRNWFLDQSKYKTDESKRTGKPKNHSDIFGIEGSFRKLEID